MNDFIDKLTDYYKKGSEGIKIIYFCVLLSLAFWIFNFITGKTLGISLVPYFLLSAKSFIPFIWTVFTFPFIQGNLLDLLFTMVMIYFTERIFRVYFNGESFVKFFFLGSMAGAVIFLLFSYITGQTHVFLQGAVLGVYSVMLAIISYNPKMQVTLFPLPLQFPIYILGLILIGLDIISVFGQQQFLAPVVARLGAAAFGYLYMKSFQTGNDFLGKLVPDFNTINKIFSFFKTKSNSRFKAEKGGVNQDSYARPKTDEEFAVNKVEKQKKIDVILDKISRSGYDSLTKEEKDFLFNSSR